MNVHDQLMQMRNARRKHQRCFICPFCGEHFFTLGDLIEHQDAEGHVIEEPMI